MPEQQEPGIADVMHALELVRRDVQLVDKTVKELVSLERYTIEHEAQQKEIARIEKRVDDLDKAREVMRHLIMSSFLFPLAVAVIFYLIQNSGAS